MSPLRGYITSYPPRLRQYGNALIAPVAPQTQAIPPPRTTKRGTTAINYAEDGYDEDDFDDSDAPRRPTGLRSLRREDSTIDKTALVEKLGKEIHEPVQVQGVFRDWMIKRMLRPACADQLQIQAQLPLTLIPIRIDLEVPAHQPLEPFPIPRGIVDSGINPTLPGYRRPDPLPAYRIKDAFLWNLHEALATPDEFAIGFVRDMDLPNPQAMTIAISNQVRQQLEEYAGVALHPLFQNIQPVYTQSQAGVSRDVSATPGPPNTAARNSSAADPAVSKETLLNSSILNVDDAYRCMINLNINLQNKLYTDKFEWSLLHPPGMAEEFAKVTCADLGLNGEWVGAIAHGIYEAVLKLKKEVCESGSLISGMGGYGNEMDNQAANGAEAGWRYDPEGLGDEWEPKVETLSKEEIEKREGDRERQIRRLRRETARFSSTAGITPDVSRQTSGGYFDIDSETPLGRGERNKRKKRFRSPSPTVRGGTPGGRGTPDTGSGAGYGGGGGSDKAGDVATVWSGALQSGQSEMAQVVQGLFVTAAAYFTNGIKSPPSGQGICTVMISQLVDRIYVTPAWHLWALSRTSMDAYESCVRRLVPSLTAQYRAAHFPRRTAVLLMTLFAFIIGYYYHEVLSIGVSA